MVFHSFSLECNIIKALCQKTSEVPEEENIIFGELEIRHNKVHIKKCPVKVDNILISKYKKQVRALTNHIQTIFKKYQKSLHQGLFCRYQVSSGKFLAFFQFVTQFINVLRHH